MQLGNLISRLLDIEQEVGSRVDVTILDDSGRVLYNKEEPVPPAIYIAGDKEIHIGLPEKPL